MKYNKLTVSDIYGGNFEVDKSILKVWEITDEVDKLISNSKYSKGEVAERLGWTEQELCVKLSNDREPFNFYQLTHILGSIDHDFEVVFKELEVE